MRIDLNVNLDLPRGWAFTGLWYDHYEKDPHLKWSADADFTMRDGSKSKTMLSVESHGGSPQLAIEGLSRKIAEAVKVITDSAEWYGV